MYFRHTNNQNHINHFNTKKNLKQFVLWFNIILIYFYLTGST